MSEVTNCPPDIVYHSDDCPGFSRKKNGRGFIYFDCEKKKIKNKKILKRIEDLVIPPIWTNVWICEDANGHLQVTGHDLKKRKQYIYHPLWIEHRQKNKYDRLSEFGHKIPLIRRRLEEDIKKRGWPKEKILALTVMMLDEYYIRIGNKHYEHENKTYGLTTLRRKHIAEQDGQLYLSFRAKSGKDRKVKVESKKLIRLIKKISELPGYEVFKYIDQNKKTHRLHSHDVNEYIESISGAYFTAKDFRTWGGTVLAIDHYEEALNEIEKEPRKKLETTIIKKVAQILGNTVAVCREYYIHPKVMETLLTDDLDKYKSKKLSGVKYAGQLSVNEKLALKIIEN